MISHSQPLTLRLRSYEKSRGALNYWGQNLLISSVQKKSFLIRPVLGINRISSMCLSIFLNFFCTYHPRTPPKGTCSLLKMVPPKIEPKHGLLDINRIDSMHLSTPASKSNDWCVVFFYVRSQIHSDVIDTLMKFLLLLRCM